MTTDYIKKLLESIPKTWLWIVAGLGYIGLFAGAALLFNQFTKRVESEGVEICNAAQLERDLAVEKQGAERTRQELAAAEKRLAEQKVEEVERVVFRDRVVTKVQEVEKIVMAEPGEACKAEVSDVTLETLRIISEDARRLDE